MPLYVYKLRCRLEYIGYYVVIEYETYSTGYQDKSAIFLRRVHSSLSPELLADVVTSHRQQSRIAYNQTL